MKLLTVLWLSILCTDVLSAHSIQDYDFEALEKETPKTQDLGRYLGRTLSLAAKNCSEDLSNFLALVHHIHRVHVSGDRESGTTFTIEASGAYPEPNTTKYKTKFALTQRRARELSGPVRFDAPPLFKYLCVTETELVR